MIRIFIIEDHPIIVDGLRQRFRSKQKEISIAGWKKNVDQFIFDIPENSFDIIILDLWLPDSDPIENLEKINQRFPKKPIIIFTYEKSAYWIRLMLENGVKAYLFKDTETKGLINIFERVMEGKTIIPDLILPEIPVFEKNRFLTQKFLLKPTERAIIVRLSRGETLKEIALKRKTSVSAVEKALQKVRVRFKVHNNPELIRVLIQEKEI